jgi:pimeloyl-ACP methyl ester carboxylesterase
MATFVLLHGAYHAGWHFHLLAEELEGRGHRALAPDLPSEDPTAGAERYAAVVARALAPADDEIVAVGHSLAGLVLPLLPVLNSRIRRLVFLAAMPPDPGLSLDQQIERDPSVFSPYQPHVVAIGHPDGSASCPEARALELFFHDCPPALAIEAAAHLRRQHWRLSQEVTPLAKWPGVPVDYVLCRADRVINPEWSRRMARERLGVEPLELDGGHSPFLTRPAELAALLDGLQRRGPE